MHMDLRLLKFKFVLVLWGLVLHLVVLTTGITELLEISVGPSLVEHVLLLDVELKQ